MLNGRTVSRGNLAHILVTHALALTHTRRRFDVVKSVPDCFLPPTHSWLDLSNNKLVCVPRYSKDEISGTQEPWTKLMSFSGPATFCIDCEAGKFLTTASHRCSTLCLLSGILLPRMYDVAATSVSFLANIAFCLPATLPVDC